MKQLFLNTILITCITSAFSQNRIKPSTAHSIFDNERWGLKKYVWSHTHYKSHNNDKPVIDFDAIDTMLWLPGGQDVSISRDGHCFAYGIAKKNIFQPDTLVVYSLHNSWRKSIASAKPGFFSGDSKQYIYQNDEGLCLLGLHNGQCKYIKDVSNYKLPANDKNEWLACQLKTPENSLLLLDLRKGKEKRFDFVDSYEFDKSGSWLACRLNNKDKELIIYGLSRDKQYIFKDVAGYLFDNSGKTMLLNVIEETSNGIISSFRYITLPEGESITIWAANNTLNPTDYNFDADGKQVVFMVKEKPDAPNTIWYWKEGMNQAVIKVNSRTAGMDADLLIQGPVFFTDNNSYVQFSLRRLADTVKFHPELVSLDVWSYRDSLLQTTQSRLPKEPISYVAILNIESGKLIRLEKGFEKLKELRSDHAIIYKCDIDNSDRYWESDYNVDSCWLVSLQNGSRKFISRGKSGNYQFSPNGHYLVYCDADKQCNYFSYDVRNGNLVKISNGVPAWQLGYKEYNERTKENPKWAVGIAGWFEEDGGILVYDNYDIWQMDLSGEKRPVNITNHFGSAHQTILSLIDNDRFSSNTYILKKNDTLLLRAFNRHNKYNGFYRKILGTAGDPELLFMGPYFFEELKGTSNLDIGMHPLKAADTSIWIVKRQTATEAPNFFLTKDFKKFKQLTNLQPHKANNWLTTELHSFKQLDGTVSQGILYKPENLDPAKKYPVIISFYSSHSDGVFQYPTPNYLDAPKLFGNPAWMVSHGYLVFTPDIYFTKGQWGPSTLNTIDGAARYLGKLPFVDGKRIGACGHSNSGRFGYYLLTHSNLFAAMCIGSGTTDLLSISLSQGRGGQNYLRWAEFDAFGTGLGNLWKNKPSLLDHTSVLHADNVTSPVLMFHNKKDGVPFSQAYEMFVSLYRLEKKAWLLQYDEGDHLLTVKDELKDFTMRFTQFFDHYLKGAPAPRWMTEGIPFRLKTIESRYELDMEKSCGRDCAVCQALRKSKK